MKLLRCTARDLLLVGSLTVLAACGPLETTRAGDNAQFQKLQPSEFSAQLRPRYWLGADEKRYSLEERMTHYNVPGVALAIIQDGEIAYSAGFGVLQAGGDDLVNADSVFSIGSVSKIATASMALKLQADGTLDLDEDISQYLKSWSLPENKTFPSSKVTLRMILSHSAGFNLHGFGDFDPGEALPSVFDTLNGSAPASNNALRLTFNPGTEYKYSGGGYTLAQLILADITEQSFENAAEDILLAPLGMSRSTFVNPLPEDHGNIAKAHDRDGRAAALPRGYEAMPEMAASGLWTSANDLGALVVALIESYRSSDGFLPQEIATDMMTKVSPSQHGLGPRLEEAGETYFFHHGGANNSYRAWIEGHLATGDGLVVLTNGAQGSDLFVEIRNAVADAMTWKVNEQVRLPELSLKAKEMQTYAGAYKVDPAFPKALRQQMVGWIYERDLVVTYSDEALALGFGENATTTYSLVPTAPNRFILTGFDMRIGIAEVEFHKGANGKTDAATLRLHNAQSHYIRQ